LLLENRHESVEEGDSSAAERLSWKLWKISSLNRSMMNLANGKLKNAFIYRVFTSWTRHRADLHFSDKTFNQMWKEKYSNQKSKKDSK
jgi:L-lactate dehydrogenase complex protein LldF